MSVEMSDGMSDGMSVGMPVEMSVEMSGTCTTASSGCLSRAWRGDGALPSPPPLPPPIDAPCTQCLRHGDPIHAQERLTLAAATTVVAVASVRQGSGGDPTERGDAGRDAPRLLLVRSSCDTTAAAGRLGLCAAPVPALAVERGELGRRRRDRRHHGGAAGEPPPRSATAAAAFAASY
jgi:hypothetical protein